MTDSVLVTGGLGRAGRWITAHLADAGKEVVCADLRHPGWDRRPREGVSFRAVDLTDAGETSDLVQEIDPDAVVHFGAIPTPQRHSGVRVFENNAMGAYNVLEAAGRVGARVVSASSESTYGFPFADGLRLPDYLPVDESHPLRPEDPYGLSKVVAEEVAATVARKYGIAVASLRPSWIQYPGEYACRDAGRSEGGGNFWSYVDVRDVCTLVERALDADIEGHEPFLAVAADNWLGEPTAEAVEATYGELPADCELSGEESAFSTAKAAEELGWEPAHGWRDAADEEVPAPSLVAD